METNRKEREEDEVNEEGSDKSDQGEDTEGENDSVQRQSTSHILRRSKQWTSDRIRKIIQKQSKKWLGTKGNLSAWRHIVIGISRRYLNGRFATDKANEDADLDGQGKENINGDSPWDLQAEHETHIAGIIYGRKLRQAPGHTAPKSVKSGIDF